MIIRPVAESDASRWIAMRKALWPEDGGANHADDVCRYFAGQLKMPLAVLVAETGGRIAGFVELNIRPYAEGCATDRVGFLEGWYVAPDARGQGVGRALVAAAEKWARAEGCAEFASNALANNDLSAKAHRALGFEEVEVIRCFRKALAPGPQPEAQSAKAITPASSE